MSIVDLSRKFLGFVPLGLAVAGRKRDVVFGSLDPVLRGRVRSVVDSSLGRIDIDPNHGPERYLAYAFENIYRYYSMSPLGRYIMSFRGGTFVDVGANLGVYSIIAKRHGLRALAVEPDPAHFRFLERNSHLVGSSLNLGVSDCRGSVPLHYEAGNPGATSLFASPGSVRSDFEVEVDTLSSILSERGLWSTGSDVCLIKIDVEGLEESVVRGMDKFLSMGPRPDIWCEVRGDRSARNGGSYREVIDFLAQFGYKAYDARSSRFGAVDDIPFETLGIVDLLFRPAGSGHGQC